MSTKASQNQPAGNIVQILNDLTWMTAKAQRVLTQRRELVGESNRDMDVISSYSNLASALAEADRVRHSSFFFDLEIDLPSSNTLESSIVVSFVVAMGLWKAPDNIYSS
jgi:hypothetical protein